ncbi:MAG: class I SAM-dependent methyltransferase [Bdellovibrio bacteriovorus]
MKDGPIADLIEAASVPYRTLGRGVWHAARGKLRGDPVFAQVLRLGPLARQERILDLGCGQGLLAAWLQAAGDLHRSGAWPQGWPPPPRPVRYLGIDQSTRAIARARSALPPADRFRVGDIRTLPLEDADAVVLIDVLHYLPHDDQERVLGRAIRCLRPGGLLLLRIGDAAGGLPFQVSRRVDLLVARLRGHPLPRLYCRRLDEWQTLLQGLGCRWETLIVGRGAFSANVLALARPGTAS